MALREKEKTSRFTFLDGSSKLVVELEELEEYENSSKKPTHKISKNFFFAL
jgi:hypothetical protein